MVGKIKEGKTFGGCVSYNLDREKATILHAEGIRTDDSKTITQDFNAQRKMNPNLSKAVGHIILSWSAKDCRMLSPGIMLKDAIDYLDRMNIRDTQRLIVLHTDRAHPHLHIIYNRVDNQGNTIGNSNLWKRNLQVTRAITKERGYRAAENKDGVNRGRLKGADKIKYEIYDAVKSAIKTADDWGSLKSQLQYRGISLQFKSVRGANEIQGVSFSKGGVVLKGSQVDRSFSYKKLDAILSGNKNQLHTSNFEGSSSGFTNNSLDVHLDMGIAKQVEQEKSIGLGLLESTLGAPAGIQPDVDDELMKRKRRKIKR